MTTPRIPKNLQIDSSEQATVPIKLVGKVYNVKQPKSWLAMKMALVAKSKDDDNVAEMMEILQQWVLAAFPGAQGQKVLDRLDDPKDDLDLEHIMDLVEKLAELSADNRPTS